jgi:hypothetical protein
MVRGKSGLGLVLAAALQAACLVTVEQVSDRAATTAFDKARAEAQAVAGRRGPAHELNVLAYDPDDRELVRVSVPMWLARKVAHEGYPETSREDDSAEDRAARAVARHVSLKELERAGLGVLVEVAEDDGEQVLIWLR